MRTLTMVFIVLMFALSIAVLVANASLFATRDDYKSKLSKEQKVSQELKVDLKDTKDAFELFKTDAQKQVAEQTASIQGEKDKREAAEKDIIAKQREIDSLNVQIKQINADRSTQANNITELTKRAELNEEKNSELKVNLDQIRAERNKAVTAAAELENRIESLQGKIAQLQTEKNSLVEKIAKITTGRGEEQPPSEVALDGIVKKISKEGFIIISVGKNDGVKEGEFFDVFRGTKYVSRINIVQVGTDFALGREDKAFGKQTGLSIREGDRAANYLGTEIR